MKRLPVACSVGSMLEQIPTGREKFRNTPQLAAGIEIFRVLQVCWLLIAMMLTKLRCGTSLLPYDSLMAYLYSPYGLCDRL
jgi:hypothetical protein